MNGYRDVTKIAGIVGLCISTVVISAACIAESEEKVHPDAAILQDFQRRIEAYLKLRKEADDGAPKLKETNDPAKIRQAQDALSKQIRAARASARPGDIFTPDVQKLFRRLMYPETKGAEGAKTKELLKEDAPPPGTIPFRVNAPYPEGQPLPTVPPDLLARLPKLPEQLEYRIIGRHMLLRDIDANLVVDYMLNAIR